MRRLFIAAMMLFATGCPKPPGAYEMVMTEARREDPAAFDPWVKHKDSAVRARAALALGRVGEARPEGQRKPFVDALRELLDDDDVSVQRYAAFSLGLLGSSAGGALPEDPDPAVRDAVIRAAAWVVPLDDPAATPEWRLLTRAQNSVTAEALGIYGWRAHRAGKPAPVEDAVVQSLVHGAASGEDRWSFLYALFRLSRPEGLDVFLTGLTDENASIRAVSAQGLGAIEAGSPVAELTKAIRDPDPIVAAHAVRALSSRAKRYSQVREPFLELIRKGDPHVAMAAAESFAILRDRRAADALLTELKKADAPLFASLALAYIGSARDDGVPTLMEIAGADWHRQRAAAIALSLASPEKAMPVVEKLSKSDDERVRAAAVQTQARLEKKDPPAMPKEQVRMTERVGIERALKGGRARVTTSRGVIVLELFGGDAPLAVENFQRLTTRGFYNGHRIHQVIPGFIAQTGCPRGDGLGGPGYRIPCELGPRPFAAGTVGMALDGRDTGGSQFFFTLSRQPHVDAHYTVFAQVVDGLDVVKRLQAGDTIETIELLP